MRPHDLADGWAHVPIAVGVDVEHLDVRIDRVELFAPVRAYAIAATDEAAIRHVGPEHVVRHESDALSTSRLLNVA